MIILGIDPGPEKSAFARMNGDHVTEHGLVDNVSLREKLSVETADVIAIEMIACYGMAVGAETFDTCVWIGRFCERSPVEPRMVFRREIKLHFCQSMRAKDANIRQAIIDSYGGKEAAIGRKAAPGPLYGVSGHSWAALAVAIYVEDTTIASSTRAWAT